MPSQRPYFLSSFIAAFRPQGPSLQAASQQPNKHTSSASPSNTMAGAATASNSYSQSPAGGSRSLATSTAASAQSTRSPTGVAIHSPRNTAAGGSIPIPGSASRRRGSDSSSEGFRDVLGAEKWYIGGRTAGGEEKFFKLGVVRRVRSNDGLSLDRLSL